MVPVHRVVCPRCRRPERVCYCHVLPRLETRTKVVILQHPRERDMPIGTARMASLCLPSAKLHVGKTWDGHPGLHAALHEEGRTPVLLYPGPGAKNILTEPPAGDVTLVVVDGTWHQAKTVVRDNPILKALPRYAFEAPEPSNYRIRAEPKAEYVSTIEALMHVLGALEGDAERFRSLLDPLNAMVDAQLACQAASPVRRNVRKRKAHGPAHFLPPEIAERWDDLVCVAAEANVWPYRGLADRPDAELVHWVARRVSSGESFDAMAAPRGVLSPSTTFHAQLDDDTVRGAEPVERLVAAFDAWLRPTDVVCSWGFYGPNLYVGAGGTLPGTAIDVRAVTHRLHKHKVGCLEEFADGLGRPWQARGAGRAGKRVGMLEMVLGRWRELLA